MLRGFILFAIVEWSFLCGYGQPVDQTARIRSLLVKIDSVLKANKIPGLGISVIKDLDITVALRLGFANLERKTVRPVAPRSGMPQ